MIQDNAGTEAVKDGENQGKSKEEYDTEEEDEEEGETQMTTPKKKKARGRRSTKEVREQATYKDKLQESQLTLEKLLKNTRNTSQQGKFQKGIPSSSKSK